MGPILADVGGQHCPCPVLVSFHVRKKVSGVCLLSGFCPDFLSGFSVRIFCLDSVSCPNSVRTFIKIAVRCLPVRIFRPEKDETELSGFYCPCPPTSVATPYFVLRLSQLTRWNGISNKSLWFFTLKKLWFPHMVRMTMISGSFVAFVNMKTDSRL